jgi:hypothetical protein
MAKHRFASSTALARPVIVQVPSRAPSRARRVARRAAAGVRHVARRGAHHGKKALPTMSIAIGGAVVGYLQGKGYLDKLPQIGGSKVITLGLAGWAATRFVKNPWVRTAGVAALAAAAVDFGRVQGGGTSGFEDVQGDAGGGPFGGQGYPG